jgi:hypothetical protein
MSSSSATCSTRTRPDGTWKLIEEYQPEACSQPRPEGDLARERGRRSGGLRRRSHGCWASALARGRRLARRARRDRSVRGLAHERGSAPHHAALAGDDRADNPLLVGLYGRRTRDLGDAVRGLQDHRHTRRSWGVRLRAPPLRLCSGTTRSSPCRRARSTKRSGRARSDAGVSTATSSTAVVLERLGTGERDGVARAPRRSVVTRSRC